MSDELYPPREHDDPLVVAQVASQSWPSPETATGRTRMILIRYIPEHPDKWLVTRRGVVTHGPLPMTDEQELETLTLELKAGLRAMRHAARKAGVPWRPGEEVADAPQDR